MKIIIVILFLNISFGDLITPIDNSYLNYIHVLFEWEQKPEAVSYNLH